MYLFVEQARRLPTRRSRLLTAAAQKAVVKLVGVFGGDFVAFSGVRSALLAANLFARQAGCAFFGVVKKLRCFSGVDFDCFHCSHAVSNRLWPSAIHT